VPDGFQPGGRPPAPPPLDLVQDFVNTEIPDWNRDDIATPAALAAWLEDRGLLAARDRVDADTFVAARALRSALRELALANTLGEPPGAERRAAIDTTLAAFPLAVRLTGSAPGLAPASDGASTPLAHLVAIVAEAQLAGDWERMKACRQETCGWLFYDGSRNRSSSWCSIQICGGREKARAYRRKRAGREVRRRA
jgi:predicted RNA-binding Zn ribbon-like protein